jgi:hypothetical protein
MTRLAVSSFAVPSLMLTWATRVSNPAIGCALLAHIRPREVPADEI